MWMKKSWKQKVFYGVNDSTRFAFDLSDPTVVFLVGVVGFAEMMSLMIRIDRADSFGICRIGWTGSSCGRFLCVGNTILMIPVSSRIRKGLSCAIGRAESSIVVIIIMLDFGGIVVKT